ncbi:MAG: hypothetical protein GX892_13575 [Thermoanaerobacteraceae bacterium]|nr:hypothetical protein [Thermoanaerobacteraceae bacterium]
MPRRRKNLSRVIPEIADEALRLAEGNRDEAFRYYLDIVYQLTGEIITGCEDKDLQAYYDLRSDTNAEQEHA